MPQSKEWDHYWSLDQTKRFAKVSWSKKRIISILDRYVKKDGYALDAGCGSGFFSNYLFNCSVNVFSADYSQEALDMAKQVTKGHTQLVKINFLEDDIYDQTQQKFDLVFTDGLFEHFTNSEQDKILQNFIKSLNNNGLIVTFVPNRFSPWELIRPLYMPGIEEDPFTLKQLIDLNQRNGLSVIEQGGINTLPIALSPDKHVGHLWGMLLYTVAKKQ